MLPQRARVDPHGQGKRKLAAQGKAYGGNGLGGKRGIGEASCLKPLGAK